MEHHVRRRGRERGRHGACTEWTFTLPFREARQFKWMFQAYTVPRSADPIDGWRDGIYTSSNAEPTIFRALLGSTSELITTSSVPIAYVLPETTVSRAGDPVTYRLHVTSGGAIPQSGSFWAYP